MKKAIACVLSFLMCFSCFSIISFAEETTSEHLTTVPDGYIGVYTVEDLYCVRNDLTANYILMNDIDLSEVTAEGGDWNFGGRGWNPIGSNDSYSNLLFEGIFDGNGYSISGMNMNIEKQGANKTEFYFGLFSAVSGIVKNLTVGGKIQLDLNLSTKYSDPIKVYAGGIAAYSKCGVFENCINKTEIIVNEELTANGRSYTFSIGGIVGRTDSMSDDSFSNSTHISRCLNMGKINVNVCNYYEENNYVAGIVGYNAQVSAVIEKCINAADIYIGATPQGAYRNSVYASGIANANSVDIFNCYNTANITAVSTVMSSETSYASGICTDGGVSFCYNVGLVEAGHQEYPIGPIDSINLPIGKSYYLSGVGKSQVNDYYLELTNAQMKLQSMYYGWDFDTVWTMEGREDYPYPELRDIELYFPGEEPGHEHSYVGAVTTPATHTSVGIMTYTCSCGDSYTEEIAKLEGHNFTPSVTKTPTHTEEGVMTYTCLCGDSYTEAIPTLEGHDYKATVTEPTCEDGGYTTYICKCGDSYIADFTEAKGHSYSETVTTPATHTSVGIMTYTCSCGDSYTEEIAKLEGHSFTPSVTKTPTHTEEGVMTYTCSCGDSYTEAIPTLEGHAYKATVTEPTCEEGGYTIYTCKCGDSYIADYTEAKGHSYSETITTPATHTEEGVMTYTCFCGDSYTEAIPTLEGHDYKAVVTAPTCEEGGYTTYTCICGDSYVGDYVDAKGHEYASSVTAPATHLTEGLMVCTCECGDSYTEVIPTLPGHTYTSEIIEEPDCKNNGTRRYYCECGHSYTESIYKLEHIDDDDNSRCDRCNVAVCSHMCIRQDLWALSGRQCYSSVSYSELIPYVNAVKHIIDK